MLTSRHLITSAVGVALLSLAAGCASTLPASPSNPELHGATQRTDVAARFGIAESAVKKRLKLSRVSPNVLGAYRDGELTLDQVQAFAVTDDHAAQERVLSDLSRHFGDPDDIRRALTSDPGSPLLNELMATTWQQEIDLYRDVGANSTVATRRKL